MPVYRDGSVVAPGGLAGLSDLDAARLRRDADVELLDPGVRRLVNPHVYHVSITARLDEIKREQVARYRGA